VNITRLARPGAAPARGFNLTRIVRPALGTVLCVTAALLSAGCGNIPAPPATDGDALPLLDNFHAVKDGQAYRSAQLDPTTLALVIETYGIRTVVNLRGEDVGESWYDDEVTTCQALGVAHVDIDMSANALPARDQLLKLYDTFESADYPILMHCKAGADRAGAASAIWLMEVDGDDRQTAQQQLALKYGHFASATPEMDELVAMFVPDRNWILNEYPVP
jgi:protein tyrosine phosphatase (PTP) superfamily phosphohydrolase (DUF442 family)